MAMIRCKDCKKEISEVAPRCPYCGAQTKFGVDRRISLLSIIALLCLSVGAALILWSGMQWFIDIARYKDNDWRTEGYNYESPLTEHEEGVVGRFWGGIVMCLVASGLYGGISAVKKEIEAEEWLAKKTLPPEKNTVGAATKQEYILLTNGGWKCTCGKVNEYYTGTCSCGIHKRDAENAAKIRQEAEEAARKEEEEKRQLEKNQESAQDQKNSVEAVKAYKELLDEGIITQEDFDKKKKELLGL